jgi:hypothetical protein
MQKAVADGATLPAGPVVGPTEVFFDPVGLRRDERHRWPSRFGCDGLELVLQGCGLCEWGIFGIDLYHGALYVERALQTAAEGLAADQAMLIHLDFVRSLSAAQLRAAFQAAAEANGVAGVTKAQPGLVMLCEAMADVASGDGYSFLLRPGVGTTVLRNGRSVARIPGEDFRRFFVLLYLGDRPPTAALRDAMLGDVR